MKREGNIWLFAAAGVFALAAGAIWYCAPVIKEDVAFREMLRYFNGGDGFSFKGLWDYILCQREVDNGRLANILSPLVCLYGGAALRGAIGGIALSATYLMLVLIAGKGAKGAKGAGLLLFGAAALGGFFLLPFRDNMVVFDYALNYILSGALCLGFCYGAFRALRGEGSAAATALTCLAGFLAGANHDGFALPMLGAFGCYALFWRRLRFPGACWLMGLSLLCGSLIPVTAPAEWNRAAGAIGGLGIAESLKRMAKFAPAVFLPIALLPWLLSRKGGEAARLRLTPPNSWGKLTEEAKGTEKGTSAPQAPHTGTKTHSDRNEGKPGKERGGAEKKTEEKEAEEKGARGPEVVVLGLLWAFSLGLFLPFGLDARQGWLPGCAAVGLLMIAARPLLNRQSGWLNSAAGSILIAAACGLALYIAKWQGVVADNDADIRRALQASPTGTAYIDRISAEQLPTLSLARLANDQGNLSVSYGPLNLNAPEGKVYIVVPEAIKAYSEGRGRKIAGDCHMVEYEGHLLLDSVPEIFSRSYSAGGYSEAWLTIGYRFESGTETRERHRAFRFRLPDGTTKVYIIADGLRYRTAGEGRITEARLIKAEPFAHQTGGR